MTGEHDVMPQKPVRSGFSRCAQAGSSLVREAPKESVVPRGRKVEHLWKVSFAALLLPLQEQSLAECIGCSSVPGAAVTQRVAYG